ncbi:MAG: Omp28-related outer membrane protein [Tidjanibacter sp.]|nr:Omp28-related outer membrane protein [Tidjanibacter sp.]
MKNKLLLFLAILFAGTFVACKGTPDGGEDEGGVLEGSISLIAQHNIVRANGTDAVEFYVLLTDKNQQIHDVTANSEIYVTTSDVPLAEPKFASTEAGEYTFYAVYGFAVSEDYIVRVVDGIVELPADPAVSSTDFAHRMLLIQHTGTACTQCPTMMSRLKELSEDEAYNSRYYHVASHSYNTTKEGDPAYSKCAATLSREELKVTGWPDLTINLTQSRAYDLAAMKAFIDLLHEGVAAVGVSASVVEEDGVIYTNVGVKAGKAGNYRVAVWILEDNIYAVQSGATMSWQNTHNNCLREMVGGSRTEQIYGANFGTIEAGKSIENIYAMEVADNWVVDNCKVLVIVTTADTEGNYELVNTTVCKVGESVAYQYN